MLEPNTMLFIRAFNDNLNKEANKLMEEANKWAVLNPTLSKEKAVQAQTMFAVVGSLNAAVAVVNK